MVRAAIRSRLSAKRRLISAGSVSIDSIELLTSASYMVNWPVSADQSLHWGSLTDEPWIPIRALVSGTAMIVSRKITHIGWNVLIDASVKLYATAATKYATLKLPMAGSRRST